MVHLVRLNVSAPRKLLIFRINISNRFHSLVGKNYSKVKDRVVSQGSEGTSGSSLPPHTARVGSKGSGDPTVSSILVKTLTLRTACNEILSINNKTGCN